MKFVPDPYQVKLIELGKQKGNIYLGLDTGLGKTVTTLKIADNALEQGKLHRALVVAPKAVAEYVWPQEIEKWDFSRSIPYSVILGTPKQRLAALNKKSLIYIINYDNLKWLMDQVKRMSKFPFDLIVFDEISRMKSAGSNRFKALRFWRWRVKQVIGLSGTPTENSLLDLWAQIYMIDGGKALGTSFVKYRRYYFYTIDYQGNQWVPHDWAEEKIFGKIRHLLVTLSKRDYLDLPPVIRRNIPVHFPEKARKQYEEYREDLELLLDNGVLIESGAAKDASMKLRQICGGFIYKTTKVINERTGKPKRVTEPFFLHDAKIQALRSLVEEACGEPVLVGYYFEEERERIVKEFGKDVRVFQSGDADLIKDWEAGRIKILLAHPQSAGHGLNLQYGGHILIWYSYDWKWGNHYQFESRIDRRGQTKPCRIYYIIVKDSIEERVLKSLTEKEDVNNTVMQAFRLEGHL